MDIYGFLSMFFPCFLPCFFHVVPLFQAMAPRWRFIFALVFLGVPAGVCGEAVGPVLGHRMMSESRLGSQDPILTQKKDGKVLKILNFTEEL